MDSGIADLGFGMRAIATPLATSAPLVTKLAVAEIHIGFLLKRVTCPGQAYHLFIGLEKSLFFHLRLEFFEVLTCPPVIVPLFKLEQRVFQSQVLADDSSWHYEDVPDYILFSTAQSSKIWGGNSRS